MVAIAGKTLKTMRDQKHVTRAEIARRAKIPYRTLMRVEHGQQELNDLQARRVQAALDAVEPNAEGETRIPVRSAAQAPANTNAGGGKIALHGDWILDPVSGTLQPAGEAVIQVLPAAV